MEPPKGSVVASHVFPPTLLPAPQHSRGGYPGEDPLASSQLVLSVMSLTYIVWLQNVSRQGSPCPLIAYWVVRLECAFTWWYRFLPWEIHVPVLAPKCSLCFALTFPRGCGGVLSILVTHPFSCGGNPFSLSLPLGFITLQLHTSTLTSKYAPQEPQCYGPKLHGAHWWSGLRGGFTLQVLTL